MGLVEKRAIKDFQEGQYPEFKKALDDACGFDVNMEVDWETVTEDGMAHLINESMEKVYFQPVIEGFQNICADEMGKEALKEALKLVKFCNNGGNTNPGAAISFKGGTLTVDHQPYSNMDDVKDRTKEMVAVLESNL